MSNKQKCGPVILLLIIPIILLLLPQLTFCILNSDSNKELKSIRLINVLFRHGQRSPVATYPNDPYKNYSWPGDYGALLDEGILQLYKLGKNLRKRYKRLIPIDGKYTKQNIEIKSSIVERCLTSAASFLSGFMPPPSSSGDNYILPIAWQPIPIYPIPFEKDLILRQSRNCPKYSKLYQELWDTYHLYSKNENDELYKYLTKHTGMNITNILQVEILHNNLHMQRAHGLKLPQWTDNVYPNKTIKLSISNILLRSTNDYMKKILSGPILNEFLNNIENYKNHSIVAAATNNNKPNAIEKSIYIYSAHDLTLINFMRGLNFINQTTYAPDFAATIVLELHSNPDVIENDYEIKIVYYRNSEMIVPQNIDIPNCNAPCSLGNFQKSYKGFVVQNFDEMCKLSDSDDDNDDDDDDQNSFFNQYMTV